MKKLLLAILLLTLVSCSEDSKKQTADLLTASITGGIATGFDCSNRDAIFADVKPVVYKWLSVEIKGRSVGAEVCRLAIAVIVPQVIGTVIPANWNCSITKVENATQILGDLVCSKL